MSDFWAWTTFGIGVFLGCVSLTLTLLTDWSKLVERRTQYQNWRASRSATAADARIAKLVHEREQIERFHEYSSELIGFFAFRFASAFVISLLLLFLVGFLGISDSVPDRNASVTLPKWVFAGFCFIILSQPIYLLWNVSEVARKVAKFDEYSKSVDDSIDRLGEVVDKHRTRNAVVN